MSVKMSLELILGDLNARYNMEVPVNASLLADANTPEYQRVRERIIEFASSTLTSLGNNARSAASVARPAPDVRVKVETEESTNSKKRKLTAADHAESGVVHDQPVQPERSYVRVVFRDWQNDIDLIIPRRAALNGAISKYAMQVGVPIQILRLFYDDDRVSALQTPDSVSQAILYHIFAFANET